MTQNSIFKNEMVKTILGSGFFAGWETVTQSRLDGSFSHYLAGSNAGSWDFPHNHPGGWGGGRLLFSQQIVSFLPIIRHFGNTFRWVTLEKGPSRKLRKAHHSFSGFGLIQFIHLFSFLHIKILLFGHFHLIKNIKPHIGDIKT